MKHSNLSRLIFSNRFPDRHSLNPGDVVVLEGPPMSGKTHIALKGSLRLSRSYRVGFYSLETSCRHLIRYLSPAQIETLASSKLEISVGCGLTVDAIRAIATERQHQIIVIDSLSVLSCGYGTPKERRAQVIRQLLALARNMNVAVVAISTTHIPIAGAEMDL